MLVPLLLSSCATIFTKSTYPVIINTSPSDASIVITDKKGVEVFTGNSPVVVKLKSSAGFFTKAEYIVKINLKGYEEKIIPITLSIEGWYFGNLLLGGLIGMVIIDPATGAMWTLDTEAINTTLTPKIKSEANLEFKDIKDVPEDLKRQMVRLN